MKFGCSRTCGTIYGKELRMGKKLCDIDMREDELENMHTAYRNNCLCVEMDGKCLGYVYIAASL
jgi:hypothetical protein